MSPDRIDLRCRIRLLDGSGRCPEDPLPGTDRCRGHTLQRRTPRQRAKPERVIPLPEVVPPEVVPEPVAPPLDCGEVVYYLGHPATQLVKIGTTTKLRQRVRQLRFGGWTGVVVLATEPGGYALEHLRHLEYRRFRAELPGTEREWFQRHPLLMQHVNATRHRYGILCPGSPIEFSMIAKLQRGSPAPAPTRVTGTGHRVTGVRAGAGPQCPG